MPWLYYSQTPQQLLKDSEPVNLVVSFYTDGKDPGRVNELTYFLARYNIDGTFEGFQELKTQLCLCPMTYLDVVKSKAFGVVTENTCELELDLFAVGEFAKLPENTNIFFELFIKDATGAG